MNYSFSSSQLEGNRKEEDPDQRNQIESISSGGREDDLFGIYYINNKIKYLKIKCDKIKNILNKDDNTMVLSYLVNFNKIV